MIFIKAGEKFKENFLNYKKKLFKIRHRKNSVYKNKLKLTNRILDLHSRP